MATISHVAARAGVSKATVSRVVNGTAPVGSATRRRVEAAIEALDFRPSTQAQQLALGLTASVVLLVTDADRRLVHMVMRALSERGSHVTVVDGMAPSSRSAVAAIDGAGGMVLVGDHADEAASMLVPRAIPVVALAPGPLDVTRIVVDTAPAHRQLAQRLAAEGAHRVALLDGAALSNSAVADLRVTFAEAGLRLRRPMRQDDLRVILRNGADAIVAASAPILIRMVRQAIEYGVALPTGAGLACLCEDATTVALGVPAVAHPYDAVAELCAETLRSPAGPPLEIRVPAMLRHTMAAAT